MAKCGMRVLSTPWRLRKAPTHLTVTPMPMCSSLSLAAVLSLFLVELACGGGRNDSGGRTVTMLLCVRCGVAARLEISCTCVHYFHSVTTKQNGQTIATYTVCCGRMREMLLIQPDNSEQQDEIREKDTIIHKYSELLKAENESKNK